ncbi:CD3324 family protein [Brevibacillus ginsengisoli]|uniref:CD3324 family protein n=1 Tax=Brevibacillus ginsengisoli TaxID=363854 RepID=UPI003CEC8EF1
MKYVNAETILPMDLVEKLQDFVQGEYLYIPAKKDQHKRWGQRSGYREEIDKRNLEILQAHASGSSIEEIANSFCLSVFAVRKIIYQR